MKLLIDDMPSKPCDCDYAVNMDNPAEDIYECMFVNTKHTIICDDTSNCPFFISLRDAMVNSMS